MASLSEAKPHAVITPLPIQGNLISMMKLAKLLHYRGFHITYVNTEYNHKRLLKSRGPNALDGLPDFCFETIPDGLPPTDVNVNQDIPSLCVSTQKNCLAPFRDLLARLNDSASNGSIPPVSCLISDGLMTFTNKAAQELGVPNVLYWPPSTYSYLALAHYRSLVDRDIIPLKDDSDLTNGKLDDEVDWIPGMKNIRIKDLPIFTRTMDPNNLMVDFLINEVDSAHEASAIIFNTFDSLEGNATNALSSMFPSLLTIGPLPLFLNQIPQNHLESIGSNLWKEENACLEWLESKEPGSVVYVNYGSSTVMSAEQLHEFAWGLANSKKPFLWIIRPDLVSGGSEILSFEFVNETKERSLITSWCPQEKVLNHPSIGGFLTHCGWNSMTESICGGVPMLCWPFFTDQQINCRYACKEWGIGMEIDNNVKREEVEMLVNELMVGQKGKKMKHKVMEWKKMAEEATRPGGSSYMNLEKLIKEMLLKPESYTNASSIV
ncbi:hypothetical protein L6164_036341 [Bauhinia variegata]|uniref:Uncharacterized protein n=1 Tax=Bauhinia variegata TaxID=167791 RepID=A0ACB9KGQ3_BAUVA|nr:hypothetical protein L6164_036341 [Bauhinia variegata]